MNPSLFDVFKSIPVSQHASPLRRFLSFVGPGYLVAVGYMDPGNWATSLTGGSQFGYTLLSVVLLSSLMAIVLQSLCARLAIATGLDLAQACRAYFPKWMSFPLWILAELAIIATDLAEVIGTAIGLQLLFGLPLFYGVLLTALNTFLILWLQSRGFRKIEGFIIALLAVIVTCFAVQMLLASPVWGEVLRGFVPSAQIVTNPNMLFIAIGILGATVMPHNLYLHSGIVLTRNVGESETQKREAIRFFTFDSTIALTLAFFINASILILAAAVFFKSGQEVTEIGKAHELLAPLLSNAYAPILFAIALICCGLNSTVTATLAGQIVMEGFINLRLSPWVRSLVTRLFALIPAIFVIIYYGESETAKLLVASQVVLGLQLPFAIVPLVLFTASRAKMGNFTAPKWLILLASLIATLIIMLNIKLLYSLYVG